MNNLILDLKYFDKPLVGYLFEKLSKMEKKNYSLEEVLETYESGLEVVFLGGAPYKAKELNYAIFYKNVSSSRIPINVTFSVDISLANHENLITRNFKNLVFAGVIIKEQYSCPSSTWQKSLSRYDTEIGYAVNDLFRKCYNI